MSEICLIVHNVRSIFNVGSLFRTADGLGVNKIILSGYTPYPEDEHDERLPHERQRISQQINKTALGATDSVNWQRAEDPTAVIQDLKAKGYEVVALEQSPRAIPLTRYIPAKKVALIVGSEVGGLGADLLALADKIIEIPMKGQKESFNVSVAAAIALYGLSLSG